jgi:hypothetical protein
MAAAPDRAELGLADTSLFVAIEQTGRSRALHPGSSRLQ